MIGINSCCLEGHQVWHISCITDANQKFRIPCLKDFFTKKLLYHGSSGLSMGISFRSLAWLYDYSMMVQSCVSSALYSAFREAPWVSIIKHRPHDVGQSMCMRASVMHLRALRACTRVHCATATATTIPRLLLPARLLFSIALLLYQGYYYQHTY